MIESRSESLFNSISRIYGLFYKLQKKRFTEVIESINKILDLTSYEKIIDVGCGTGALCSVLNSKGLKVTGIDPAEKMLNIAKKKPENKNINFLHFNILETLPFKNKSFDVAIASYVAHGMEKNERKKMYTEMSRVTKSKVIIHDYNTKRSLFITIIEWLEKGDYFRFIKNAESEMKDCITEMNECFSKVEVINVGVNAAWYICTPV